MAGLIIFWAVAAALAAASGLWLWRTTRVPGAAERAGMPSRAEDMAVYRDQLAEVERDLARGTLTADEAGRARTEIARRMLDADRAGRGEAVARPGRGGGVVAGGVVALAMAGAVAGYWWLGVPGYPDVPRAERIARSDDLRAARLTQAEAVARQPKAARRDPADAQSAELVRRLRAAVAERPDDVQGLTLLAQNEATLGNWADAADAWGKLVAAKGKAASAGDYAALADAMILAAGGTVSPEAEAALAEALRRDPGNGTARFYMGLAEAQVARPDLAFRFWAPLLESSPPGAPWVPYLRDRIEMVAQAAGVDYALPPEAGAGAAALAGPSPEAMAAAQDMSPEDRKAMIEGMVSGLMNRLATQGGTSAEWAQLIVALGVMGNSAKATAIWTEARGVFGASPGDLAAVDAAAAKAGLKGAEGAAVPAPSDAPSDAPLPAPSPAAAPPLAGPTAGDMAAAQDMSPEDRKAMIAGMVQRLSDRLATQGGSSAEWARLIVALGVMGDADRAKAVFTEAKGVFSGSPADLAAVTEAAQKAGVAE
jgi:cytochrome c-type biogenesis protein CcmH